MGMSLCCGKKNWRIAIVIVCILDFPILFLVYAVLFKELALG